MKGDNMLTVKPIPRGIVGTVDNKPGLYRVVAWESVTGWEDSRCLYVESVDDEPGLFWPIHRDRFSPLSQA